jgi:hypothetical protein
LAAISGLMPAGSPMATAIVGFSLLIKRLASPVHDWIAGKKSSVNILHTVFYIELWTICLYEDVDC